MQAIAEQSTSYPSIKPSDIQSINIMIPLKEQLNEFTNIIEKINNKIWNNQQQSQTLTEIRDNLLPKLMSGEIRIPDATEQEVDPCLQKVN